MNLGQYITDDDVWQLEQFSNWQDNYLFWTKKYILDKIKNTSSRFLENKSSFEIILKKIEQSKHIEDLKIQINDLSKLNVKGAKAYFNPIYKFFYFLEKVGAASLTQIENKVVKAFIISLKDEVSDITRNNAIVAIKNFFKYVSEHNVIRNGEESFDFKLTIVAKDVLKIKSKTIDIISPDKEYTEFLMGIDEIVFKHDNTRNKLLLKIALFTGMRVSEITHLKYKDIEIENKHFAFNIIGKGNKARTLYVSKKDISTLWNSYIKENPITNNENYAFPNSKGEPISDRAISNYVRKILELKNIKTTKKGLHLIRHSLSTKLIFSGEHSIEDVSALLGHEDISTTQIYTHITNEHIKKTSQGISNVINKDIKKYERSNKKG